MAGRLRDPVDLASAPIIRDSEAMFAWEAWLQPNGLDKSIIGDGPVFSDASLCLDTAIAGQGVFLAWKTLANDAIRMGRLKAPFPGRFRAGIAYGFVTGQRQMNRPLIRAFREWLEEELSAAIHDATAVMR
jgi:DNA-binding transcriptional LysR family regulator